MTDAEWDQSVYEFMDGPIFSIPRGGIRFPSSEEVNRMKTNEQLLSEAEQLEQQAAELRRRAEEREKYGVDPFKNGTVLKVEMKYRSGNRSYTYAVIKIGGRFFLSGKMGQQTFIGVVDTPTPTGMTWDNFVAWLAQGDATVWQAKNLQQVL